MKPVKFDYYRPESLGEAIELLSRYGNEASLLAGGQSLVPLLNMRLARPAVIIDLNRITGLDYIKLTPASDIATSFLSKTLAIGALTRQRTAEMSAIVRQNCPLLSEALGLIGHLPIRNRGTLGGNLAHADPASEIPAVLVALAGELILAGPEGERNVAAADFFVDVLTTSRREAEIVKEVRFPGLSENSGYAFYEVSRQQGNYALAGAAAYLELDAQGHIQIARLGLCSVAPVPLRAMEAEAALLGELPTTALFQQAGQLAAAASDPASDLHAEADYRRALAAVVTQRALEQALARI